MLLEVDHVSREVTKRQEVDSQYRRMGMEMEGDRMSMGRQEVAMFIVSIKPKNLHKMQKAGYTRCPECVRMLSVRPKNMRKCAECAKIYGVSMKPQKCLFLPRPFLFGKDVVNMLWLGF